ncbi:MAG: class IIb bacteriocin, lactobin A/cerein 7B family [Clostridium paraputrificum]
MELTNKNFSELDLNELETIDGGLFPIVIAGVTITKGAAIAGGLFTAGAAIGIGWAFSD